MPKMQDSLSKEMHATRKTILIVEDDPYIGEFLTMAISQETPYEALLAETGERAFEMIQHVKPSLFVLDYVLGSMNGLDLYDRIRTQRGFETIPAIFLSASLQKYQDKIKQRHLVGFVKPIDLDELLLSIHQALN